VSNDIAADPEFPQPYRERALAEGFRAAASFPLFLDEAVVGVFVLYSADAGVFDADELLILQELASDISYALDYMAKADRVSYMAHYDVLTGLPNRALLMDRMVQYLTHAKGLGESAAFFLVDVQRFRNVNDTFGRHVGDEVLKVIASRLSATIGDESSVARVGNDLFAFIGKNVSGEREAMEIAKKALNECFAPPMTIDGRELRLAGRLGVSLFPSDAAGADTLYRDAEAALAKAKKEGQEYLFYSPEMTARVADKLGLENRLRHAIEAREFVLHYQPKFNARTGALSSVEALIRWQEPSGKLVPPNDFIPLLEETSLILPVGEWALHEAVRQRTAWRSQGLAAPRIAVNVSALQLRSKDFVAVLERVVGGVPDHGIDLEITESLIMTDVEDNIQKLTVAKRMGMRIFVDDFGTGYSSLRYIAKLPLDALKIDRSFIVAMASSPEDMTIVSSIVSLGRDLNLKVVAEGVDSEEQAKLLRLLKCDELQGFLFSRPVPADKIAEMLRRPERVAAPTV
jgi:diguanylate cyclase (GGDEF)-like protein